MQHIVIQTANSEPLLHEDGWAFNGIGRKFSHKVSVFLEYLFFKCQNSVKTWTCFKKSCMFSILRACRKVTNSSTSWLVAPPPDRKCDLCGDFSQNNIRSVKKDTKNSSVLLLQLVSFFTERMLPILGLLAWSTVHNSKIFLIKRLLLYTKLASKSFQNMNHV